MFIVVFNHLPYQFFLSWWSKNYLFFNTWTKGGH